MPKVNINRKNNKKKNSKEGNLYNAENEIIIGVTTKPKENVRVENKKTTRTNSNSNKKKSNLSNNNKTKNSKNISNKEKVQSKKKLQTKNIKVNTKNVNEKIIKENKIKNINRRKIIISIFILLFITLGGTIYYLTTPVFNIANIEIYGNEKNSEETYISLSKINLGATNIFGITGNSIKNNIKENAYVEDVIMKRKLPNTLQIYITERKVSYQVAHSTSYVYIDNQGYILEMGEKNKSIPIIEGFKTFKENVEIGKRLLQEDLIKLNVVAKIINYCAYNTIENKITNIDVTDNTNYIVKFKEDKKTVYLGDASNLSERLSLLKTILKNEKNKEIEIFMNGEINKDDVYIRYK